jgi:hypothetical protein
MATAEYTSGMPIEITEPHVNSFRNAASQIYDVFLIMSSVFRKIFNGFFKNVHLKRTLRACVVIFVTPLT